MLEVQITVAVIRVVAPHEAVTVLSIIFGMPFVVIQTVENALSQRDDLVKAVQVVESIDLTLYGNNEGIHAVEAAKSIEVTDSFVKLHKSFFHLSQICHHQTYVSLRSPAFRL